MDDTVSWMTLCHDWSCVVDDAASWMTLYHRWHNFMDDTVSWLNLCHGWNCVLVDSVSWMTPFRRWHCAMDDNMSWMTLCRGWHYVMDDNMSWMTLYCEVLLLTISSYFYVVAYKCLYFAIKWIINFAWLWLLCNAVRDTAYIAMICSTCCVIKCMGLFNILGVHLTAYFVQ